LKHEVTYSRYHFVGVAGVGMSAVAQAVCFRGGAVTGSDRYLDSGSALPILAKLEDSGITLFPQDGSGVDAGAEAVVVSTAIEPDNPDLAAAEAVGLPVLHRSEVLAQLVADQTCIAVAGTSGKSTVTGMVGWILEHAGLDPTVVNGAPVINWCSNGAVGNVRRGSGALWVIEADESDRSLLNFEPEYAVITNVSADHFDLEESVSLFKAFADQVRGDVIGALDGCDPLDGIHVEVTASSSRFCYDGVSFNVPLPGRHNAENAVHAAELCKCVGVSLERSAEALASFRGIRRRLEVVGEARGVTVIDDYGHNPAKIAAAWNAVVPFARRGIVVWRPHGYGPLRTMLDELTATFEALCGPDDHVILLPVYDAGGTADRSIDSGVLAERLRGVGVRVSCVSSHGDAQRVACDLAEDGDAVIVMGARDPELPELARCILNGL
jgi:UDP-N-acetylmuramate-alanine ligase